MSKSTPAHLSAAETARRLGVTVRALRIYERHGLVRPGRTAAGWRVYGSDEIARLHQVLALKRLGLTLAQIAQMVSRRGVDAAALLALQERELAERKAKIEGALALVQRARRGLSQGKSVPIDDLISLIKETQMSQFEPSPEFKALVAKHTDPDRVKALHPEWTAADQARVNAQWSELIAEAEQLKDGDPGSSEALDLARRWRALVNAFTRGDQRLTASVTAIYREGFSDPAMARHMPLSAEVMRFMNAACARLAT